MICVRLPARRLWLEWLIVPLLATAAGAQSTLPPTTAPTAPVTQLNPFEVTDTSLRPDSTALKIPVTLHDTPRSVTILGEDDFRDRGYQRVIDTFNDVPGFFAFGDNEDTYRFYSRGYNMGPDDTRFDGFAGYAIDMTQSPSLFGIESVVFLRGPAGLLYGVSALPGGLINLVGKEAKDAAFTNVDVRYETYAGAGIGFGGDASAMVDVDTNGRLAQDGSLLYRLDAVLDRRGYFNDGIHDHHRGGLATVTWKFGPDKKFSLTPMVEYQTHPFAYGRGFVVSPSTSLSATDGRTGPVNFSDLSPRRNRLGGGIRLLVQRTAGVDAKAELAPGWQTQFSYRYLSADTAQYQFVIQPNTLRQLVPTDPLSWVISRQQTARETYRRNHGFDWQTSYERAFADGGRNLTQLGYNGRIYRTVRERAAATQPNQSPINIYSGLAPTPLVDAHPALIDSFLTDDYYWNLYGQNQTTWAQRWVLTIGAGYGEQEFGRKYPSNLAPPANLAQVTATRKGELTPNAGLLFRATKELALYANYATSFSPAPGDAQNFAGAVGEFHPTTGRSYEVGVKQDAADGRVTGTLSVFETRLDRALVQSDPTQLNMNGVRYFTQTEGSRRARGAEFSGAWRPAPAWRLDSTASYLDARYFGEARVVGSRMERTPPWAFSGHARYDVLNGAAKGLGVSLGGVWQDARWSTQRTTAAPDPLLLPSYGRVDAAVFYRLSATWDAAINCENLFDKIYFITGATGSALEVAAPRTVSVRISYRGR